MTAKEYLSRYINLGRQIAVKEAEVAEIREALYSIASALKDVPVRGNDGSDRLTNLISVKLDLEKEVRQDKRRLLEIKDEIEQTMNKVEDETLRKLLDYRYLKGGSFKNIARMLGKSESCIKFRLHPKALSEIQQYLV